MHKNGSAWEKVVTWFGYKLHLPMDSAYELPLAFRITKASAGDAPELLPLADQLTERHPGVAERWEEPDAECAADKGYDSNENNAGLYRRSSIERVNSRINQVLQFEHHTIRGQAKMELRVTLAPIVMLAMALGRIRANQADLMRSITAPVRRAS